MRGRELEMQRGVQVFPNSEGFSIQTVNALRSGKCCVRVSPLVSPEHTVVLML